MGTNLTTIRPKSCSDLTKSAITKKLSIKRRRPFTEDVKWTCQEVCQVSRRYADIWNGLGIIQKKNVWVGSDTHCFNAVAG